MNFAENINLDTIALYDGDGDDMTLVLRRETISVVTTGIDTSAGIDIDWPTFNDKCWSSGKSTFGDKCEWCGFLHLTGISVTTGLPM